MLQVAVGLFLLAGTCLLVLLIILLELGAIGSGSGIAMAVGAAPVVCEVICAVFVRRETSYAAGAIRLDSTEAPELWELVDWVARRVGTRPPAELWLTGEANAAVFEDTRLLGLVVKQRRLYVGLPLLLGLSRPEFTAVLCHEFAHYAGSHGRLNAVFRGSSAVLADAATRLGRDEAGRRRRFWGLLACLIIWMFNAYVVLYFRVLAAILRRQEFDADACSGRLVGAHRTGQALRAVHATSWAWEDFLERHVIPVRRAGQAPADLFAAFQAMLADRDVQLDFAERLHSAATEQQTPYDSHPSLQRRLAALGAAASTPRLTDRTPAVRLLGEHGPRLALRVQRVLFPPVRGGPTHLPLPTWLAAVASRQARDQAKQLLGFVRRALGSADVSLGMILAALADGRLRQAARRLWRDQRGPAANPLPTPFPGCLAALIGSQLVARGQGSWELSWIGASRLHHPSLTAAELHRLVLAAASVPAHTEPLRRRLAELGLDLDAPTRLDPLSQPGLGYAVSPAQLWQVRRKVRVPLRDLFRVGRPSRADRVVLVTGVLAAVCAGVVVAVVVLLPPAAARPGATARPVPATPTAVAPSLTLDDIGCPEEHPPGVTTPPGQPAACWPGVPSTGPWPTMPDAVPAPLGPVRLAGAATGGRGRRRGGIGGWRYDLR